MYTRDRYFAKIEVKGTAHLVEGTPADNSRDMVEAGRSLKGEKHPRSRLTRARVREIRRRHEAGDSQRKIARDFGVGQSTIRDVVLNRTWVDPTMPTR